LENPWSHKNQGVLLDRLFRLALESPAKDRYISKDRHLLINFLNVFPQ